MYCGAVEFVCSPSMVGSSSIGRKLGFLLVTEKVC